MADKDVTAQSEAELAESLAGAKKELFNLRFQHATGQLENTARIPAVKRHIARINTELRARELASGASS